MAKIIIGKDKLQRINTKLNYKNQVVSLIRRKYSIDDELAIMRQRDTKPEEFKEYTDYVEACKKSIKGKA